MRTLSQRTQFSRYLDVSMAVLLETTLGDIVIDLFTEERPKGEKYTEFYLFLLSIMYISLSE